MDGIGDAVGEMILVMVVVAFVAGGAVVGGLWWLAQHLTITVGWR